MYQHALALKNHSFEQRLSLSGAYVFCTSKAHFGHLGGPHVLWIQAVKLAFPPKMYLHDVNPPSEIKQPKVFQSVLTQLTRFKRRSAPATWSPVLGGVQWPEGRPSVEAARVARLQSSLLMIVLRHTRERSPALKQSAKVWAFENQTTTKKCVKKQKKQKLFDVGIWRMKNEACT